MFAEWKRKREEKKAKEKAIAESRYWKDHALMQKCLRAMRGGCTVAPMELHEAAIAVVNIALQEDTWSPTEQVPEDFLPGMVYILWDDAKLPVLKAPWSIVDENMMDVKAVSGQTFLVSETLDRIIHFDEGGGIRIYSVA